MLKLFLLISTLPQFAQAAGGDVGPGNGGDMCEDRIKIVRDDISNWISNGGSAVLNLPNGVSQIMYVSKMQKAIGQARVSCTSDVVAVAGAEKTCKNFVDADGTAHVLCNFERFMKTESSGQYMLVHHEFAGLAGFETSEGGTSFYPISNQISGSLKQTVETHIAVQALLSPEFNRMANAICRVYYGAHFLAKPRPEQIPACIADLREDPNTAAALPVNGYPNAYGVLSSIAIAYKKVGYPAFDLGLAYRELVALHCDGPAEYGANCMATAIEKSRHVK